MKQEFGFDVGLKEIFSFVYKATDKESGLTEHEFDHVFIGKYDGVPKPNPDEIDDWKWVNVKDLRRDLRENPEKFTPWFRLALDGVIEKTMASPNSV